MRPPLWLFTALVLSLSGVAPGGERPDDRPDKGAKDTGDNQPPPSEDEQVAKVLKKARRSAETERDRLLKQLHKLPPPAGDPTSSDEVDQWFRRLAGDKPAWRRAGIVHKPLVQVFDRIADRLGVTDGQITREQFYVYARRFFGESNSLPWLPPTGHWLGEADQTFSLLDLDRDGRLSRGELSTTLGTERRKRDVNRDGYIDRGEYRAYFQGRVQRLLADPGALPLSAGKLEVTPGRAERREGSQMIEPARIPAALPPGLPDWFHLLDADQDGQVGLYEWRASRWPVAEHGRLDRNGDALLTAEELLDAAARAKALGAPDDLLARRLPENFRAKPGGRPQRGP
jgi:hypothetical protein